LGGHSTWLVAFTIATSRSYKSKQTPIKTRRSEAAPRPSTPPARLADGDTRVWEQLPNLGREKIPGKSGEKTPDRRHTLKSELRLARLTVVVSLMAP